MGELTLGVDDTEAQAKAIYSYNNAIERLNSYCASLIKIPNEGVRSVGTVPDNPSYRDTSKPYEIKKLDKWKNKTAWKKYGIHGENGDENYMSDWVQMGNFGIRALDKEYWLGSRDVYENWFPLSSNGDVHFSVRGAATNGTYSKPLCSVCSDGNIKTYSLACAVRPVVKLQYP